MGTDMTPKKHGQRILPQNLSVAVSLILSLLMIAAALARITFR
ncbi:MAG: hypothetical protein NBKEAIPA_00428 [Nitrospirae bacterium]|nr:MAG: hypothetical protein UZ03_NOB001003433 [Nitrospira sp. OLB3]MBV6468562.1 hypothetical protein [Nitrospirota bacterium]